jgi:hypothetical protein
VKIRLVRRLSITYTIKSNCSEHCGVFVEVNQMIFLSIVSEKTVEVETAKNKDVRINNLTAFLNLRFNLLICIDFDTGFKNTQLRTTK